MSIRPLKNVTLVIADCKSVPQAILSIKKSLAVVKPERVVLFTDYDLPPTEEYEVIKIKPIRSKEEYSTWVIKELYKYITTDFVWIGQWDSWALDADAWTDEFLEVDYVGSSWLESDSFSVGNGGGSIRTRRLMEAVATDQIIVSTHPEDNMICKVYRPYLESKYGFKWASVELADRWGFELKEPVQPTFTFHSFFHKPYKPTVVVKRIGALGDVLIAEPVLSYFFKQGYRVVLETLPEFYQLFMFLDYKIHHPDEIDKRHLKNARFINLEMAYEITPKKLHLQSYFDICGIKDGEIRNPKLSLQFDPKDHTNKLFKKYIVLHLDKRPQSGRNIYGVNWEEIVELLNGIGFDVVQIGQGERNVIKGAIQLQNTNLLLLMRLIGGADGFIGGDSGPSNIAIAMNTPAVVIFGSVNPSYIIPDESNVIAISKHRKANVCKLPYCWSSVVGQQGIECVELAGTTKMVAQMMQGVECAEVRKNEIPPCVNFDTNDILEAVRKIFIK